MHVNEIAQYVDECEDFSLVGFADVPPETSEKTEARYTRAWNIKNNSEKYGITPHEDYKQMLDEVKPDIAFIFICLKFIFNTFTWQLTPYPSACY